MVITWLLLGIVFGLINSKELIPVVYREIAAAVLIILMALIIFYIVVDAQIITEGDLSHNQKIPIFIYILWHGIMPGVYVGFATFITDSFRQIK